MKLSKANLSFMLSRFFGCGCVEFFTRISPIIATKFALPHSKKHLNPCIKSTLDNFNKKGTDEKSSIPVGAQNKIRTCTPFQALPPQGSASTNFAIWALRNTKIKN